eukprot:1111322-Karenia_brevis.AAC.1
MHGQSLLRRKYVGTYMSHRRGPNKDSIGTTPGPTTSSVVMGSHTYFLHAYLEPLGLGKAHIDKFCGVSPRRECLVTTPSEPF